MTLSPRKWTTELRLPDRYLRLAKYLRSYLKTEWSLRDYPIRVRDFGPGRPLPPNSHLKSIRWSAQIIGWPTVFGHGDTREESVANLAESFQRRVASGKEMPRPGTEQMDIQFASGDRLAEVEDLAPKFFAEVLEMDYAECFISDESSLWDFTDEADISAYVIRIREVYDVDIDSGNIVDILERIRLLSSSA
jgi:hypothetical protein